MDALRIIEILRLSSMLISTIGEFSDELTNSVEDLDISELDKEKVKLERNNLHREIDKIRNKIGE